MSEQSAKGAEYESQGQARSASPLWSKLPKKDQGLKGRDTSVLRPFRAGALFNFCHQGRRASRLPLAVIFRAFGAVIQTSSIFVQSHSARSYAVPDQSGT